MTVTIRLFAAARAAAGTDSVSAEPGTLAQVTDSLTLRFPALREVLPRCSFLIDGTATHGDPEAVQVPVDSEVDVLPPFAGG